MRTGGLRDGTASGKDERPKGGHYRGVGALLLLAGSGLVFSGSRTDRTSIGDGLGFLLALVGTGLMIEPRPEEIHPAQRDESLPGSR